jgi:hypothetical protein
VHLMIHDKSVKPKKNHKKLHQNSNSSLSPKKGAV